MDECVSECDVLFYYCKMCQNRMRCLIAGLVAFRRQYLQHIMGIKDCFPPSCPDALLLAHFSCCH